MALHPEINPSPEGLPLSIAAAALRAARSSKTSHSGSAYFETGSTADGDGVGIVTGPMAAEHGGIGRLDNDGVLHPLVDLEPVKQAAQAAQAQADSVRAQAEQSAQALREQMSKVAEDADKASNAANQLAQSALDAANKADGKADTITTTVNGHESKLNELSASLESTRNTADGALNKSSKVEATVGALSATLTRDYTPTSKADAKYATKTELNQTADEIKTTVTEQGSTLDDAVQTISQVSQKADSISSTLQQVQGNLDLISDGLYNNVLNSGFEDSANGWTISPSSTTIVSDQHHTGFKALKWNTKTGDISNNHEFDVSVGRTYQWSAWIKGENEASINIFPKLIVWNGSAWDTDDCQKVEALRLKTEWTKYTYTFTVASGYSKAMFGMGAGGIRTVFYVDDCALVDITDVKTATDTANSALSQASRVEQTLNSFKTSVSQTYQPKGDYATNSGVAEHYATKSSLEQTADSITTSVSQTYQPKGDYATNSALSSYATKTQLEQTANSITSSVSATAKTAQSALDKASTVEQTASGLSSRISEVAKTADGAVTTANEAKSTADKNTTTISQVSKTAQGALDKASSVEQSLDGFKTTVSETYQPKGDYATNSGVAEHYATKSSLEQTANGIKTEVSQKYQAKGDYATKTELNQTSTSLTAKISTAQNTANTANSTANSAKSQANNLDTLIRMDTNGVRVGKIVSGKYAGCSCLMNANGSFDVIDSDDNIVARFDSSHVTLAGGVFNVGVIGGEDLYIGAQPLNMQQYENGLVVSKSGYTTVTAGIQTIVSSPQGRVTLHGRNIELLGLDGTYIKHNSGEDNRIEINTGNGHLVVNGQVWDSVTQLDWKIPYSTSKIRLTKSAGTVTVSNSVSLTSNINAVTNQACAERIPVGWRPTGMANILFVGNNGQQFILSIGTQGETAITTNTGGAPGYYFFPFGSWTCA